MQLRVDGDVGNDEAYTVAIFEPILRCPTFIPFSNRRRDPIEKPSGQDPLHWAINIVFTLLYE